MKIHQKSEPNCSARLDCIVMDYLISSCEKTNNLTFYSNTIFA